MELTSDAFGPGEAIPVRYTKDGEDMSPSLRWSDVPEGTRELALTFENTSEPFVQWLAYKIAPDLGQLPEGFHHQAEPEAPAHLVQGTNSQGNVGYDGPLGTETRRFRYVFHLYALDEPLDASPGLGKEELERAMSGHVLDEAELNATYERPRG